MVKPPYSHFRVINDNRKFFRCPNLNYSIVHFDFGDYFVPNELEHDKTNKMTCAPRSAWASMQSDRSSLPAWRNPGSLATHSQILFHPIIHNYQQHVIPVNSHSLRVSLTLFKAKFDTCTHDFSKKQISLFFIALTHKSGMRYPKLLK